MCASVWFFCRQFFLNVFLWYCATKIKFTINLENVFLFAHRTQYFIVFISTFNAYSIGLIGIRQFEWPLSIVLSIQNAYTVTTYYDSCRMIPILVLLNFLLGRLKRRNEKWSLLISLTSYAAFLSIIIYEYAYIFCCSSHCICAYRIVMRAHSSHRSILF